MINKAEMPSVAVVMVNYNGYELTKESIESVTAIDYSNYKVVLINNGSSDQSGGLLNSFFGERIIFLDKSENKGVTAGNNAGIKYALENNFDYVLLLNNDTLVSSDFLSRMIETSHANLNSMVVPKIRLFYDQNRLDFWNGTGFNWWNSSVEGFKSFPADDAEVNVSQGFILTSTCCLLVPVAVFKTIGIMDEKYFMYFDDADFTLRATREGFKIIYDPGSVILHKGGMSSRKSKASYFQFYLTKRNIFYFYKKLCPSSAAKYFAFTKFLIINSLLCLKYLFTANNKKLQILWRANIDALTGRYGPPPRF